MSQTLLAASTTGEQITFWVLAPLCVVAALAMVLARNAVHAALFLAAVMLSLAGLYAAQDAPFLAAVQVIVYTGAILMLFLFVLMLVGVDSSDSLVETLRGQRVAAIVVGLGFAALLMGAIASAVTDDPGVGLAEANQEGNVVGIARLLFTKYVFAFEVTSALLITAALGAMVLAHKDSATKHVSQAQLSRERFLSGNPHPLPGPGVFALSDSTATHALLPDGTDAPGSVSAALEGNDPLDGRDAATGHDAPGGALTVDPTLYLLLAALLFTIGAVGVLVRRNAILVFMCIELMLNSVNLTLVTFSRTLGSLEGQIMAFFVMVVAAAEVVVGLAIIMSIFRTRRSASVDDANLLKY